MVKVDEKVVKSVVVVTKSYAVAGAHQERKMAKKCVRFECDCTPTTTGLYGNKYTASGYIQKMNAPDFSAWVRRRDDQRRHHVPLADRIVPLVAVAGGSAFVAMG